MADSEEIELMRTSGVTMLGLNLLLGVSGLFQLRFRENAEAALRRYVQKCAMRSI